mgnify:CR=1 FL=1
MKMKNIKIFLTLVVALSIVSCSDFLDKAPTTSQSTEVTLSNYAGLDKAAYGAMMPMYSWYSTSYILTNEMRSGNGRREKDGQFQSGRYATEYIWNYSADNTSGMWGNAYYVISAANNVIKNLENEIIYVDSEEYRARGTSLNSPFLNDILNMKISIQGESKESLLMDELRKVDNFNQEIYLEQIFRERLCLCLSSLCGSIEKESCFPCLIRDGLS